MRNKTPISLFIGALACDCQVCSCGVERTHKAIYITAECAAVGGHRSRVHEHTRRHDQYRSLRVR